MLKEKVTHLQVRYMRNVTKPGHFAAKPEEGGCQMQ
jgi:hypothetical protein